MENKRCEDEGRIVLAGKLLRETSKQSINQQTVSFKAWKTKRETEQGSYSYRKTELLVFCFYLFIETEIDFIGLFVSIRR